MFWNWIKNILKAFAKFFFRLVKVDLLFRIAQRLSYLFSKLVFFKDWVLMVNGRPQYYDHQINLYKWMYDPAGWSFTARGVYAREKMFRGCKVLDLCCGDGSYSYLFFSDIAGSIDAVDRDPLGIKHALTYYSSRRNIQYRRLDIIKENFPSSGYDFVIWNAAICYFEISEIHSILQKIVRSGNPNMYLCGMAPVANRYADHKTEFNNSTDLKDLLMHYFRDVDIKQIDEITTKSMYFQASGPIKYPEISKRN